MVFCCSPQGHADIGTSSRQSHLHGISFPMADDVKRALEAMASQQFDYIQLVSSPDSFTTCTCNMHVIYV